MNAAAVVLMSLSVYVFLGTDPASRLESIVGAEHAAREGRWLHSMISRLRGHRRERGAVREVAIEALAALAAELRAGTPQQRALQITGQSVWPTACSAVRFDGDVTEALHHDARHIPLLTPLAACWSVTSQQGNGLAVAVTRMAEQARVAEDVRVQLAAQMAGPRATARILMLLPLFGIAMGMLMGVSPLAWLLGTPLGIGCLLGGLLLTALGYWWTSRIVAKVEELL